MGLKLGLVAILQLSPQCIKKAQQGTARGCEMEATILTKSRSFSLHSSSTNYMPRHAPGAQVSPFFTKTARQQCSETEIDLQGGNRKYQLETTQQPNYHFIQKGSSDESERKCD